MKIQCTQCLGTGIINHMSCGYCGGIGWIDDLVHRVEPLAAVVYHNPDLVPASALSEGCRFLTETEAYECAKDLQGIHCAEWHTPYYRWSYFMVQTIEASHTYQTDLPLP